jgi:hypothetical protein
LASSWYVRAKRFPSFCDDCWVADGDIPSYQVDEESRALPYSQVFQLCQDGNGQWFVFNDIFKLVYG